MKMITRLLLAAGVMWRQAAPALALQPPSQPSEFVPMSSLPPADQLPSAPLVLAAYAFVWVAVMFYVWSIWSRLGRVERELQGLQQKTARGTSR